MTDQAQWLEEGCGGGGGGGAEGVESGGADGNIREKGVAETGRVTQNAARYRLNQD